MSAPKPFMVDPASWAVVVMIDHDGNLRVVKSGQRTNAEISDALYSLAFQLRTTAQGE